MRALVITLLMISHSSWAQEKLDTLLDGLHQDAHEGNFETYFERYTPDAVFLGTDKTERWSMEEFKTLARFLGSPDFKDIDEYRRKLH